MIILGTNSVKAAGGFNVENSCRFDSASEQTLEKSQSAGNRNTATFSAWIKRTKLSSNLAFFAIYGAQSDAGQIEIRFNGTGDGLQIGGYATVWEKTSASFRDISAWYHVVVAIDTTDSTANDRIKIYVNGVLQAAAATGDLAEDEDLPFGLNNADVVIGSRKMSGGLRDFFSGYMAEVVLIDGAALAPTSFGEFDDNGIWIPIDVSGLTFGTNGFYLDFKVSANLGNDANGGTDLGETNIAAVDQSTDTCTNNFATMNSLDNFYQGATFSDGNLTVTTTNSSQSYSTSSIMVSSGKWYVECKPVSGGSEPEIGVAYKMVGVANGNNAQLSYNANGYGYRASNPGTVWYNGSAVSTGFSQYANGDIIGIALDLDNNKLYFRKNNEAWGNSGNPESGATGTGAISIVDPASTDMGAYAFAMNENFNDQNKVFSWNFGSPPFAISSSNTDGDGFGNFEYAVPSGYFALCTKNLAEYG